MLSRLASLAKLLYLSCPECESLSRDVSCCGLTFGGGTFYEHEKTALSRDDLCRSDGFFAMSSSGTKVTAHPDARNRNSPVRVSTLMRTPCSRYSGTCTTKPVSKVAGLVRPVAELPRVAGSQCVTASSTANGN